MMDDSWLHTHGRKLWKHHCGAIHESSVPLSDPPLFCRQCYERTDGKLWTVEHNLEQWYRDMPLDDEG